MTTTLRGNRVHSAEAGRQLGGSQRLAEIHQDVWSSSAPATEVADADRGACHGAPNNTGSSMNVVALLPSFRRDYPETLSQRLPRRGATEKADLRVDPKAPKG